MQDTRAHAIDDHVETTKVAIGRDFFIFIRVPFFNGSEPLSVIGHSIFLRCYALSFSVSHIYIAMESENWALRWVDKCCTGRGAEPLAPAAQRRQWQ